MVECGFLTELSGAVLPVQGLQKSRSTGSKNAKLFLTSLRLFDRCPDGSENSKGSREAGDWYNLQDFLYDIHGLRFGRREGVEVGPPHVKGK